jgi:hypothetical protein
MRLQKYRKPLLKFLLALEVRLQVSDSTSNPLHLLRKVDNHYANAHSRDNSAEAF